MSLLPIIRSIFSRWTALQLAVSHSMGGSDSEDKYEAFIHAFDDYLTRNFRSSSVYESDIKEYLDEVLDEEFHTELDDGSSHELAQLFVRYIHLISQGKLNEIEQELQAQQSIHSSIQMSIPNGSSSSESDSDSEDDMIEEEKEEKPKTQSMDTDEDGWTTVHRKK